jgi:SAM-dependent methyltransferase
VTTDTAASPAAGPRDRPGGLPPCLYCAGTDYDLLFDGVEDRLRHAPGRWSYWRCRGCGSAILAPHPKAEDLAAFYPPVYSFRLSLGGESRLRRLLARLEYGIFFGPQYAAQARAVLRATGWRGERGLRLLDVGCGQGLRLRAFRRRGFEVVGTDLQPEVVDHVKSQLGVEAVCAEVGDLPRLFPPASFDLVTAFFLLEHIPDVAGALRDIRAVLKPGGWFAAAVPVIDGLQARVFGKRWINVSEAPRHLSIPSREGLRRVFERQRFDSVSFRPDSALNCAGMIGASLLPGAALTHAYGGRAGAMALRFLAGAAVLLSVPWILVENYVLRRPGLVVVFGRRPPEGGR